MASSRLDMKHWTKTSNGMTLAQAFGVDKGKVHFNKLTAKLPVSQGQAGGSGTTKAIGGIGAAAQQAANTAQQSAASKSSGSGTGGSKHGRGGPTGKSGGGGGGVVTGNGGSPSANRALGQQMAAQVGWTGAEWVALNNVVMAESGWVTNVNNGGFRGPPQPGKAYGIPQALPSSKMASAGADWATNPKTQIRWMLGYIKARYGDPINAWAHEQRFHNY